MSETNSGVPNPVETLVMREYPSKTEIIAAIRKLAENMETVGAAMDYFGGFDADIAAHGREMVGAAAIARTWADGIEAGNE